MSKAMVEVSAQLLKKYWSGQCTVEEKVRVEEWLKENASAVEFAILGDEQQTKERLWSSILEKRNEASDRHLPPSQKTFRYFLPIAASILAFLTFAAAFHYYSSLQTQKVQYVELVAKDGQHAEITLADGSKILLNSRSKLRYPKTFEGTQRKVFLEGEGFFNVAKDAKKPFTVSTQKLSIQVLGTQFNVKEIKGQNPAVAVSEGKVKVWSNLVKDSLLLMADQCGYLSGNGLSMENITTDQSFAWKRGELILDDLTLEQATTELERRYGITINVADSDLLQTKIRGVFHKESMLEVIRLIAAALDTSYNIKDKEVTLGS